MIVTQRPSREAFVAYWKDFGVFRWRQILEYIAFLGGLAAYVFVVRTFDPDGRFLIVSLIVAVAYLVLVPYLTIRRVHTRFARFIRCPHCGDWFGQDASGAYFGPNPKYRAVIETGRCVKCGAQILSDYGVAA
jgi:CelD/BcsL family acetyltransferase involved in cellulose biosynthesis